MYETSFKIGFEAVKLAFGHFYRTREKFNFSKKW